ncbi:hypothetical protein CERSUDRAFT_84724 [Gelatoporia subvermispora B]|uniref:DUF6534 domain-containing protein n=1 Tax=Ceriporiopsis subvermispora (strain B) TaxID=914234 RepID=M2RCM6_CERS8|nr:hypothetical protein CERSUDRAFT_84724 [Gelatoporia subvermispora B]
MASPGNTFGPLLGALLVGGLVSNILYGITCAQTFTYYRRSENDRLFLKLFVTALWVLDTADVFIVGHILYWYMVINYTNPLSLVMPVWSLIVHVTFTSVSNFLVRGMFANRVWKLSHGNIILTGGLLLLSLTDLVCGITITVKAFGLALDGFSSLSTLLYLNSAASLTADAAVALALCYFLYRSRTGWERTDSLIAVLMLFSINTGLLTVLDALASLITFAIMPSNLIFFAIYLCQSKLFINAFLATLNARETLRNGGTRSVAIQLSRVTQSHTTYSDTTMAASSVPQQFLEDKPMDRYSMINQTRSHKISAV